MKKSMKFLPPPVRRTLQMHRLVPKLMGRTSLEIIKAQETSTNKLNATSRSFRRQGAGHLRVHRERGGGVRATFFNPTYGGAWG